MARQFAVGARAHAVTIGSRRTKTRGRRKRHRESHATRKSRLTIAATYAVAIVGAAAALAGLLFVAVSVNSAWFASSDAHRDPAGQPLVLFVIPLVTGTLLLIPGHTTTVPWHPDHRVRSPRGPRAPRARRCEIGG